jgi:arylsulfatase
MPHRARRTPVLVGLRIGAAALLAAVLAPAAHAETVVLITIDTLRPDHLGCYGSTRATSPWIDRLAAGGLRFETAYSTSCWTPPAMSSIMTSLYPRDHAVTHGLVETETIIEQEVLSDTLTTLAELLRGAGFRTFGVSTTAHLTREQGFAQGFDRFAYLRFEDAQAVRDVIRRWRREIKRSPRAFLWIHFFDPHDPYIPRTPWVTRFEPRYLLIRDLRLRGTLPEIRRMWEEESLPPDPSLPQVAALRAAYDSEIRYMDETLARIFTDLDLGPDRFVILTSDHGEAFFEHGLLGHGQNLHGELVRVPMIVSAPVDSGLTGVVRSPVSILDVLPTALEAAGVPAPSFAAGRSLFATAHAEAAGDADSDRPLFAEVWDQDPSRRDRVWKMLVKGNDKLLLHVGVDEVSLFDLASDPGEHHDLSAREPKRAESMREELETWIRAGHRVAMPPTVRVSEETKERLRSLGYLE